VELKLAGDAPLIDVVPTIFNPPKVTLPTLVLAMALGNIPSTKSNIRNTVFEVFIGFFSLSLIWIRPET
jgi:hypothetical protein